MASGENEDDESTRATIDVGDELTVSVTSDECRSWSAQIGEQLEEFKTEKSDAQYRAAFMCAFLLQRFADEMDAGGVEVDGDTTEWN